MLETIHVKNVKSINVNRGIDMSITIFPNPVLDVVNINLNEILLYPINIKVLDFHGNAIMERKVDSGVGFTKLDITNLKPGPYILMINNRPHRIVKM